MPTFVNFSINKKNSSAPRFLIGLLVMALFIAALNVFANPIRNGFSAISMPVEKNIWAAGASSSSFLSSLLNAGNFYNENQRLKEENQQLLLKIASLNQASGAEDDQKQALATCQERDFNLLMAGIAGLDKDDILTIDKGSDDGVSEGMPVINQQNVLFGKVVKVFKNYSQVALISNRNSVINVKVQNFSDHSGLDDGDNADIAFEEVDGSVKGLGLQKAYLDLVPINEEIKQGDTILTSALEGSFPKDILVGAVQSITKDDQKPFQQAKIQLFLDFKNTDNLFVITNYKR